MEDGMRTNKQPMEKMVASLHRFLLFGIIFLLFSINSCSSHAPEDKTLSKETSEGVEVKSVKIKGETISVGENADTVYDRIGTGSLTTATNDPVNPNSFLKFHSYISEGKTYRISICKTEDLGFDHVCKISILKFDTQSEVQRSLDPKSRGHRDRLGDKIDNSKSAPKVFTDEDLQKYGSKK
jgi:hypothetical protein